MEEAKRPTSQHLGGPAGSGLRVPGLAAVAINSRAHWLGGSTSPTMDQENDDDDDDIINYYIFLALKPRMPHN